MENVHMNLQKLLIHWGNIVHQKKAGILKHLKQNRLEVMK